VPQGGAGIAGIAPEPLTSDPIAELVPLLDLAEIQPRLTSLAQRLHHVLEQIEAALPESSVRLCCIESADAANLENGAIRVVGAAELDGVPHFRAALRTGSIQFATSAPEGADASAGEIAAAVPIHLEGQPWGVLQVSWAAGLDRSLGGIARLLEPIGRLLELAIRNQTTLEKLVFIDPLTGAYNRAFYERQVALEIERAHRTDRKFALLVVDVDDFKAINDRYGHRAGDQVLAQLAQEVRSRMRKIDLLFRYGGEEFVVLLPGGEPEDAKRTAERLRQFVSEMQLDIEGAPQDLRVTVSVGTAVYPDQARTQSGIFKVADEAMYRAKRQGKNCVVMA
jgi:diguanylate cyclase (GGDEF)-like protein